MKALSKSIFPIESVMITSSLDMSIFKFSPQFYKKKIRIDFFVKVYFSVRFYHFINYYMNAWLNDELSMVTTYACIVLMEPCN